MKKMLLVTVTRFDGSTFQNPLMLSEARLVSQLAQSAMKLEVMCMEVDDKDFKATFGL